MVTFCVCAEDKNFNLIILSSAHIRMLNYKILIDKKTPFSKIPPYVTVKQPFILEIENETRKYVLLAKSKFDLEEWFTAIYAQIESLKSNKLIAKSATTIVQKEREIALKD